MLVSARGCEFTRTGDHAIAISKHGKVRSGHRLRAGVLAGGSAASRIAKRNGPPRRGHSDCASVALGVLANRCEGARALWVWTRRLRCEHEAR
jgi:hypothetical protein